MTKLKTVCLVVFVAMSWPSGALAHWCSNIFTSPARLVVKPETTTVQIGGGTTELRVYLRNNFPYQIDNVQMRGNATGYDISVQPSGQNVQAGQDVVYVLSITPTSGPTGEVQVDTLDLQVNFRLGDWRDGDDCLVNQNPSQSLLTSRSEYGDNSQSCAGGNQSASLSAATLADNFPSATLASGAPTFSRTGIEQLINFFGYRFCYSASGSWRSGSDDCPSPAAEGSAWTSIEQFGQNCMRAGVELGIRKAQLGSNLTAARQAAVNALEGGGSSEHLCIAAVVGGLLWEGASASSSYTSALSASGAPQKCTDAGLRALDGSNETSQCSGGEYYEEAACAAAEGLRGNFGPVSILTSNAGDGSSGGYTSLYYAYMLYLVAGHQRATSGVVPFYPDLGGTVPQPDTGPQPDAIAPECTTDDECDDADPCTTDSCSGDSCTHAAVSGCCTEAGQCDDSDPCTTDSCDTNSCAHDAISGCCTEAGQCDDGDPCTTDSCDTNSCTYNPVDGCCTTDANCNDSDPCTADSCATDNSCAYAPVSGCCTTDAQCEDSSVCTADSCGADNSCAHGPIAGCCASASDCNDGNSCTTDSCDTTTGNCSNEAVAGCCAVDTDCDDGQLCTADSCGADNSCAHAPISGCCSETSECDDSDSCTTDSCDANSCSNRPIAGCCSVDIDCDDDDPCSADSCDPTSNTCTAVAISGCCIRDAQCSDGSDCTADTCVDNVCTHRPLPGCCQSDADCADNSPCTTESCTVATGECELTPVAGCCAVDTDCDDGDDCTADSCDQASGTCSSRSLSGCESEDPPTSDAGVDSGSTNTAKSDKNWLFGGCSIGAEAVSLPPLLLIIVALLRRRRRAKS